MRSRASTRAAFRPAIALGVAIAVLAPGAAATAATTSTTSAVTTTGPGELGDAGGSPVMTEAIEAATRPAADDAPSPRSTIALALALTKDGNGPFTPTDQPGGDAGDDNGIVRTLDAITYRVTMNSSGGVSINERFTLTAPTGTSWAGIPAPCTGAGSAVVGQNLTCNLGDIAEGQAIAVPAVLNVSGDLKNGDTIAVTATGTADGADNGSVSATSPSTTVSAAARYNLSKNVVGSRLNTDVVGPDGKTPGIQMVFPMAVDWDPVVQGQGLLGFERSAGPMTFTDDLSKILGDVPSGAVLWNGGRPACGVNEFSDWRFSNLPGGRGGTANSVTDSGTITCEQATAGDPVKVKITDTVTDPTHLPTQGLSGILTQPNRAYFVSGYISLWMPFPPSGTSVDSVNTYTPLQTTSASGAANFPGGSEPIGDNSAKRNIIEYAPGGIGKSLYRVIDNGKTVENGSAKQGDPWATAGTLLRSDIGAWNNGLRPFTGTILCDTFDRSTQQLTRVGSSKTVAWSSGLTKAKLQYAAYDMASPEQGQRQATCNDGDGPWYDQPEDVPGGISAVGAVRATGDLAGGKTARLYSYVETKDAADGTRAYDFGHGKFGPDQKWIHDTWSDANLGAGPLSDSVIITENLARVEKTIVDAGHDASDTPDKTSFAVAGNTIDYALYPSLTNGKTSGTPAEVTVQDVLPLHTSYVTGSASQAPKIDSIEDAKGQQHQRLTWTLTDVEPNKQIAPITYTAAVSKLAPAAPVTNEVTVASPTDKSDEQYRRAQRAVQIVTTGGVGVEKSALEPVVVTGDQLEWTLGYINTDATVIRDADLIDVLPFRGDARNSAFHGTAGLASPVHVDTAAGETVVYTNAKPSTISLDGKDSTNEPGGSTTWCAEAGFGARGCPTSLDDVTAFRIQRTAPIAVGDTVTHVVALTTTGQHDGDRYTNRFGLRASNLDLPVQSNPATIRVTAGAIGDHVWTDQNGNGIQDPGEPGIEDVDVRLTGTDDQGGTVDRATVTDGAGDYRFGGLRPGEYTITFRAPEGRSFTRALVGTDRTVDSDAGPDGRTAETTVARATDADDELVGVQRIDTIDAGILPGNDVVGPPGTVDPGFGMVPVQPDVPGGSAESGDATASPTSAPASEDSSAGSTRTAGALAFTGSTGLLAVSTAALLLTAAGGVLVGIRRVRRR